jgi:tetratricopeptide (TPR) repeat protein
MVQRRYDDALREFERALAITRVSLDAEHPAVVFPLLGVGRALLGQGHADAALAPLEQALTLALAVEASPALRGDARFALARALWDAAADSGRDRGRARVLARLARDDYALAEAREGVAEVAAWLAAHE